MNNLVGSSIDSLPQWVAQWAKVDASLISVADVNGDHILQWGEIRLGADMIMLATPELGGLPQAQLVDVVDDAGPPERDLGQRQVHRRQPSGKPGRVARHVGHHRSQGALNRDSVPRLARPGVQAKEHVGRHRVARRHGVVLHVPGSGHEPLVVVGRVEKKLPRFPYDFDFGQ